MNTSVPAKPPLSKVWIDTSSGVRINKAQVVKTDINAANSVIHLIDEVLLPQ